MKKTISPLHIPTVEPNKFGKKRWYQHHFQIFNEEFRAIYEPPGSNYTLVECGFFSKKYTVDNEYAADKIIKHIDAGLENLLIAVEIIKGIDLSKARSGLESGLHELRKLISSLARGKRVGYPGTSTYCVFIHVKEREQELLDFSEKI